MREARVLLVDDEPDVLEALRHSLRRAPYRVLAVQSARTGLQLLRRLTVDVVVSDHRMPGMDGTEFLWRVQRRQPQAVRIMLTGHAELSAVVDAINRAEVFRFLQKPVAPTRLLQTLDQAVAMCGPRQLAAIEPGRARRVIASRLERAHPGITRVARGRDGSVSLHLSVPPAPSADDASQSGEGP